MGSRAFSPRVSTVVQPAASPRASNALWRSRATALLLLLAIYGGTWMVPPERSIAASLVRVPFCAPIGVTIRGGGPDLVSLWSDAAGRASVGWYDDDEVRAIVGSLPPGLRERVCLGSCSGPGRPKASLWAPMWDSESYRLRGPEQHPALTPAESAAYRAAMFDFLSTDPTARWAPLPAALRTADVQTSTFLWRGLASNLWALGCVVGLIAWVRPLDRWRAARGAHLTADRRYRGRCIHCAYSTRGLAANQCPECGREAW